jgi:hypothetical protein
VRRNRRLAVLGPLHCAPVTRTYFILPTSACYRPVQPRHRLPRCSRCSSCLLPNWAMCTGPGTAIADAHSDVGMLCGIKSGAPANTFQPFFEGHLLLDWLQLAREMPKRLTHLSA